MCMLLSAVWPAVLERGCCYRDSGSRLCRVGLLPWTDRWLLLQLLMHGDCSWVSRVGTCGSDSSCGSGTCLRLTPLSGVLLVGDQVLVRMVLGGWVL